MGCKNPISKAKNLFWQVVLLFCFHIDNIFWRPISVLFIEIYFPIFSVLVCFGEFVGTHFCASPRFFSTKKAATVCWTDKFSECITSQCSWNIFLMCFFPERKIFICLLLGLCHNAKDGMQFISNIITETVAISILVQFRSTSAFPLKNKT